MAINEPTVTIINTKKLKPFCLVAYLREYLPSNLMVMQKINHKISLTAYFTLMNADL